MTYEDKPRRDKKRDAITFNWRRTSLYPMNPWPSLRLSSEISFGLARGSPALTGASADSAHDVFEQRPVCVLRIFFSLLGTISSSGPASFITAALVADLPEVGLFAGEVGAIVGQLG